MKIMKEIKLYPDTFTLALCICFILGFATKFFIDERLESSYSIIFSDTSDVKKTVGRPKPELEYNQEKDSLVRSIVKNDNHQYKNWNSGNHYYTGFMTESYQLVVAHYHQQDYQQEEQWYFLLNDKSGKDIYINELDKRNRLSPETFKYVKSLCK